MNAPIRPRRGLHRARALGAALAIVLGFVASGAPAGAETRVLTITPSTGLVDGNTVTLSGTGFTPNHAIGYCQAIVTGNPPSTADCVVQFQTLGSDSTGAFSTTVSVVRFFVVNDVGVIDCAQPGAPCGIGAGEGFNGEGTVVTPIQFAPQPPVADPFNPRITGTVTDTGGHPVAGVVVSGYRASDAWVGTLVTTTDASGHYVLEDAQPGIAYKIQFTPPAGSNLTKEWFTGSGGASTRSSAWEIRLSAAQPVLALDAQLAGGNTLSGTVTGPGGAPAANVAVWGYRDGDAFVGGYYGTTDATGHYAIVGVSPTAPVRVRFVPPSGSGLVPEWYDNVALRSTATPLTVPTGGTTANAQLGP